MVSSLDALSGMTRLRILMAGDNQIHNLEPLRGLTQLQRILLGRNQISDLSPLANLKLERASSGIFCSECPADCRFAKTRVFGVT